MSFQVTELVPPIASSSTGHTAGPSGCDLAAIRRVRGIVESLGETWAASSGKVRWLDDPTGQHDEFLGRGQYEICISMFFLSGS